MTELVTKYAKPAYLLALLIVAVVGWSVRLESRVEAMEKSKAARAEVQDLQRTLERVDERTARIERYICRQRPTDVGC